MDKSTKNNGPIFQISRNKSYPSETTQKIFKVVSNENINKKIFQIVMRIKRTSKLCQLVI